MILTGFSLEGKNRNEFAEDVLAIIKKRNVTFRGCKPEYVELDPLGGVKVNFYGYRDNKPWKGGVQFSCPFEPDKIHLCDPAVVADICERGIALQGVE
jgi:hypothetical protein